MESIAMKNLHLNRKTGNRTRVLLFSVLVLLAVGTFIYWIVPAQPSNLPQAKAFAEVKQPTVHISHIEVPCEIATVREEKRLNSIADEIAYLNQPQTIPFNDNEFLDGYTQRIKPNCRLEKRHNGFAIHFKEFIRSMITTPTFYKGYIYTSAGFSARSFYSIHAATGKVKWAVNLSDDGPSAPLVTDSLLIFNTESCTIFALNRFTGKQVWAKWVGDPLLTHPATDGKLVFTAYPGLAMLRDTTVTERFKHLKPSHAFAALDVQTGAVVWQRWLDGDIMTTPIVQGNDIFLTTFSGSLYQLSKKDGKIRQAAKIKATSLPTIDGDRIYTTQRRDVDGEVYEALISLRKRDYKDVQTLAMRAAPYLDAAVQSQSKFKQACEVMDSINGFLLVPDASGWRKAEQLIGVSNVASMQSFVGSTVVVDDDRLYTCMGDSMLCFDKTTHERLWSYAISGDLEKEGGHLATLPMVLEKYVLTATVDGEVLFLDKRNGKLVQSYHANASVRCQPILVHGKIFAPTTEGGLVCIDTKKKDLEGWTMFLKNNAHDCGRKS
jgi:outer membrane protein assembly factor BamB